MMYNTTIPYISGVTALKKIYTKITSAVRRLTVYDIIFLAAAVLVFALAVFVPPVRSVADQGDFERVMRPCGLDFPIKSDYSFYGWAERFFRMKFTRADILLYVPRLLFIVPTTSFIYPTAAAKLLCLPFGAFDVRVLACVMFAWYSAVCMLILRRVRIKNPVLRCVFIAVFVFIFYNGINLTLFNSLYGQSVMLASFASVVLAALCLFDGQSIVRRRTIVFFTVCSCLLLGSKLQCIVFVPFLAAALVWSGVKNGYRKTGIICALFVLWYGVGGYVINGGQLNTDTQYNSVFYGILKDSPDPKADLRALGIDEDMAEDAGKHAYLAPEEYKFAPRTPETTEKFHSKMSNSKLIKFYITHPVRLISAMETTAHSAFYNRINLGTFEKKYGLPEGESSYRFDIWENARASLPRTLWFIIPVWCALLGMAAIMIKGKNPLGLPFAAVLLMGALQFPMPYMGNGAADISKQLFLFNTVFDLAVAAVIYMWFLKMDKKINKDK